MKRMTRQQRKFRESLGFLNKLENDLLAFERGELSLAELKAIYKPECQSLRKAIERERKGGPIVDESIRYVPDFLRLVVLEIGPCIDTTLDRIDNEARRYLPGGCRWATAEEQALNRSTTKHFTLTNPHTGQDFTTTVPEFVKSDLCPKGLKAGTVGKRLRRGVHPQAAFFTRVNGKLEYGPAAAIEVPQQALSVRVISAYHEIRLEQFPTMPAKLDGKERDHLRRFSAQYPGDPERHVRLFVSRWEDVRKRVKESSGKTLPACPWPWILSGNVSLLFEAWFYLMQKDDTVVESEILNAQWRRQRSQARLRLVRAAEPESEPVECNQLHVASETEPTDEKTLSAESPAADPGPEPMSPAHPEPEPDQDRLEAERVANRQLAAKLTRLRLVEDEPYCTEPINLEEMNAKMEEGLRKLRES